MNRSSPNYSVLCGEEHCLPVYWERGEDLWSVCQSRGRQCSHMLVVVMANWNTQHYPAQIFIDIPLCRQDHQNMDFWIIIASIPRLVIHLLTWYDIKMATLQSCYSEISLIYFLQWNIGDRFRAYRVSDNFKINLIVWMTFLTVIKTPTLIKKNQE